MFTVRAGPTPQVPRSRDLWTNRPHPSGVHEPRQHPRSVTATAGERTTTAPTTTGARPGPAWDTTKEGAAVTTGARAPSSSTTRSVSRRTRRPLDSRNGPGRVVTTRGHRPRLVTTPCHPPNATSSQVTPRGVTVVTMVTTLGGPLHLHASAAPPVARSAGACSPFLANLAISGPVTSNNEQASKASNQHGPSQVDRRRQASR